MTLMTKTVLLVDDESSITATLSYYARKQGYEVHTASDGAKALDLYFEKLPDLVVLDIMLPGLNGFEICESIREHDENVPIIFLSAKGDIVDKSIGFKLGADDYMTKPFEPEELMLRIETCLRRRAVISAHQKRDSSVVELGDLVIDFNQRAVTVDDNVVILTAKEFELLAYLAQHPMAVLSRQQLLNGVWGEDYIGDQGVIAVVIRKIREKIEIDPAKPRHLLTEWGYGYRLV